MSHVTLSAALCLQAMHALGVTQLRSGDHHFVQQHMQQAQAAYLQAAGIRAHLLSTVTSACASLATKPAGSLQSATGHFAPTAGACTDAVTTDSTVPHSQGMSGQLVYVPVGPRPGGPHSSCVPAPHCMTSAASYLFPQGTAAAAGEASSAAAAAAAHAELAKARLDLATALIKVRDSQLRVVIDAHTGAKHTTVC